MSKRKGTACSEAAAVKRHRVSAADEESDDAIHQRPSFHAVTGDIGLIESITLKNFMCHRFLGPFKFGPHVNFIVGNNGSGKTAILTGLIVGLGGKATSTNRGLSLKDFVKSGENAADITVELRNIGPDAYRGGVYGDRISVEHRIVSDGSRTCRLRSKSGQLVSNKREELMAILDHFNIQLDNPVSILSQEMSKQFLLSKSESDKYKFFMKATLLEQMRKDYIRIKHAKALTRQQVERQEESLKDSKRLFLRKKARYENLWCLREMKQTLEDLKKMMAWCLVDEEEESVQQQREKLEKEENNRRHQDDLQLCKKRVEQVEKRLRDIIGRVEVLREEQESLSRDSLRTKDQMKTMNKAHQDQELVYHRALNKLKQSGQEQDLLQEKIHKTKSSASTNNKEETELRRQQRDMSSLREQLLNLEETCSRLKNEMANKHQALLVGKEERDKLRLEERHIQMSCSSKLKRKNQLIAGRSNRLRRFGDHIPDLLSAVAEADARGRFIKKPVGPIGVFIVLKDPSLAVAVECCLRSFMKAFCCDNYKDEVVLKELMARYYPQGNRPLIVVSPFSEKVYNVDGQRAYHPEYPSVLDVVSASDPFIVNCLIDMRGIETVLIIKEKEKARRVMQQGQPPRNCREALTTEGDQVYPNRYYTSGVGVAKYLGVDLETEIRSLESELENYKAQLSRFQRHMTSVSEDIFIMEGKLSGTVVTLKKTTASVNHIKARIAELETAAEEQTDDLSALEEVARENQQRMRAEEQEVCDAKAELDELLKRTEDAESEFSSVRARVHQLPEDMEPLKDEQLKLEAEFMTQKKNLRILEDILQAQQESIQSMRGDLVQLEGELQECTAKASEISPERRAATRSAKSLDAEIFELETKVTAYESSHGRQEQVIREYAESMTLYRQKVKQVKDLRKFVDRLDDIILDRQSRYKVLRRSLSVRCKLYFSNFLIKMKCGGAMVFDHDNETLSISVSPPGWDNDDDSDVKLLSGGERSFSTICFLLSLWEITASPFRCLDEFDVYMDSPNRRVSLDLLLELSQRQHFRQFFFITPLDTSNLPKTDFIKMHHLLDPEGVQSETEDGED